MRKPYLQVRTLRLSSARVTCLRPQGWKHISWGSALELAEPQALYEAAGSHHRRVMVSEPSEEDRIQACWWFLHTGSCVLRWLQRFRETGCDEQHPGNPGPCVGWFSGCSLRRDTKAQRLESPMPSSYREVPSACSRDGHRKENEGASWRETSVSTPSQSLAMKEQ